MLRSAFFSSLFPALIVGLLAGTAVPAQADIDPHKQLKEHIREVVQDVKAAPTAERKRELLDARLREIMTALDRVETMTRLSPSDQEGINALRARLQEKIDELNGQNGYEAVPASQLNSFADYVQQDFEQADNTLTISLTTALLLLILIVLLA